MKSIVVASALLALASFASASGGPRGGVRIAVGAPTGNTGFYYNPYPYLMQVGPYVYSTDPTVVVGPGGIQIYDPYLAAMRARMFAMQMNR